MGSHARAVRFQFVTPGGSLLKPESFCAESPATDVGRPLLVDACSAWIVTTLGAMIPETIHSISVTKTRAYLRASGDTITGLRGRTRVTIGSFSFVILFIAYTTSIRSIACKNGRDTTSKQSLRTWTRRTRGGVQCATLSLHFPSGYVCHRSARV